MRKLCRAHALRNLLTFTNGAGGEGWADRAAVLDDVSRFMKVYGPAIFGPNTPMVIVAERGGKGNRWHAHVAMVDLGWIDYDMVRYFWTAFMIRRGWIPENSTWHIWHRGDEKGRFRGTAKHARHLAAYMAKYVGKSLADELGKRGSHRYRTWNAPAPLVERWRGYNWPVLRQMLGIDEDARPVVNPKTGKEYMSATGMRPIEIEGRFLGYWGDLDHVNPPPEWLDPAAMIETIWTGFGWSGFAMGCVTA